MFGYLSHRELKWLPVPKVTRRWGNGWYMETPQKMEATVHAPQEKHASVQKKDTLGLTPGHGVIMSPCCSLWLLRCQKHSGTEASRRGKKWMSECRPDMIGMIENHKFLMFFSFEEQNRFTAQAKRNFLRLSHTPANRNECPCCKHFLTSPAYVPAFCLLASKIIISNSSPLQGRQVNRLPCFSPLSFFARVASIYPSSSFVILCFCMPSCRSLQHGLLPKPEHRYSDTLAVLGEAHGADRSLLELEVWV